MSIKNLPRYHLELALGVDDGQSATSGRGLSIDKQVSTNLTKCGRDCFWVNKKPFVHKSLSFVHKCWVNKRSTKLHLCVKTGQQTGQQRSTKSCLTFYLLTILFRRKLPPLFRENSVFVRDPFRILGSKTFDLVRKDLPPGKHMTVRKLLASTLHLFLGLFV